jgi:predicted flap endonuclease-1-like 5' DNA nuclease
MGPLWWWWRWWSGGDPNRDTQLIQAQVTIDEQRERADGLSSQLDARAAQIAELRKRLEDADSEVRRLRARVAELEQAGSEAPPDISEAESVLGRRIELDDLTVIEGIGPKIAELLGDAGVTTWRRLAEADPADLRGVLDDAGPRFRMHDPAKWPAQADLLARGRWQEFTDMTG